ncbi:MAG TPA: aminotransferase class V-fold PLP-dependent enzyme [Gemmatimonadota bacterium]|nr:aminotransferase class V-fold PLP-dependent enzyme [Gemmatimonadota bacterium]
MTTSPAYDLGAVRRRIPLLRRLVPMNACSHAPQSEPARAAAEAYLRSWDERGMDWDAWMETVEAARAAFARLVGGEPEDVAVATSVSQATSSVASGLDWSGERRRVLASGAEFPTVLHAWRAQERLGADVVPVPLGDDGAVPPLEAWEAALDERVAVVSACRGHFRDGALQDVAAIAQLAHAAGALLYVDAYQSLGTAPFDAPSSGADFVAGGCLKYLMGIPGLAFVWVRPGLAGRLRPALTGWFGRQDPFAFEGRLDWAPGARRLDLGTPPVLEAYVARAGMAWLMEVGLDAIGAWNRTLTARLLEGSRSRGLRTLGPADPARKTPSTAVVCEDAHTAEAALRERGVLASARGPAVRLAPHFYSSLEDVDRALDAVAEVSETG